MKVPLKSSLISLALLGGVFFIPDVVLAQSAVLLQQTDAGTEGTHVGNTELQTYRLGTGQLSGVVSSVEVVVEGDYTTSGSVVDVQITAYTSATYGTTRLNCNYTLSPGSVIFSGLKTLTGTACTFLSADYIAIQFSGNASSPATPTRYITFFGVPASVPPFSLFGSDYLGVTPYIRVLGQNQSFNPNLIGNGNPSGISTTSVQAICERSTSTSTNPSILDTISQGFSFGICYALTFAFVPNQDVLQQFTGLKDIAVTKIPFSYVYEYNDIVVGVSGTSTSADFSAIGFYADDIILSTSSPLAGGNLLPHVFVGVSTSTISTYYPDSIRLAARTLVSYVLYFLFGSWVFYTGLMIITGMGRVRLWQKNFPDDF